MTPADMLAAHRPLTIPDPIAAEVPHSADCASVRKRYRARVCREGDAGNVRVVCRECGRWVIARDDQMQQLLEVNGVSADDCAEEIAGAAQDAPEEAPETRRGRWYCRGHERPVDWRGRGCQACREDLDEQLRKRRTRRRRPTPETNWSIV